MSLKLTDNTKLTAGQTAVMNDATPVSYSVWVRLVRYDYWVDDGMGRFLGCGDLSHSSLMIHDVVTARYITHSGSTNNSGYISSTPLVRGVDYHIAFTIADGEQKLYVNGQLVSSFNASGVDGAYGDTNSHPFEMACPDGATLLVQEPVVWVGYKLLSSDVLALRNSASPTTISPSNIKWRLSLVGSNGSAATIGDPGLSDLSSSGLNVISIAKHDGGTPVVAPIYDSTVLTYTPPAKVSSAFVTPSREGIVLFFSDRNGVSTNLAALNTNPTLTTPSLNGGAPLALTNGIWGVTQPAYSPWLYYPLSGPIASGDSPILTTPEQWAYTASGEVKLLSNFPVDNSGKAILPPFDNSSKSMKVGYNRGAPPTYWMHIQEYSNLAKRIQYWDGVPSGLDSNGNPVPASGARPYTNICSQQHDISADDKRTLEAPAGTYTLMWDGPGVVPADPSKPYLQFDNGGEPSTSISGPTIISVAPLGQTQVNNKITQVVTQNQNIFWSPSIYVKFNDNPYSIPVTNIRVFMPGMDENSPTFHPAYLEKLAGSKAIRVMPSCSGDGPVVDFSEHHPDSYIGYSIPSRWPAGYVVSVGPTSADTQRYFPNGASSLITFSSPHGYKTGNKCSPYIPGPLPSVDGSGVGAFPANVGGGVIQLSWFSTYSVVAIDDYSIAIPYGGNNHVTCTLDKTYYAPTPHPTDGSWACNGPGIEPGVPPGQHADLCNAVGCDLYYNMPPAATDDCVTKTIALLASRLDRGRKIYLEYGNEVWNWTAPGITNPFCAFHAAYEGLNIIEWYTKRAGQVHALAYNALAAVGRGNDLVRVFGVQAANPGGTTAVVAAYANAHGIPVDVIAIAPYFSNRDTKSPNMEGEWSLAGAWDLCGPDQIMDLAELNVVYGHIEEFVAWNSSYCGPGKALPNSKLICYEGGPERGIMNTNFPNPKANDRINIWTRHPRFRGIMLHYLQILQDNGVDLFIDFNVGAESNFASGWAWNAYYTWCMKPGTGDGSDGQYDNRISWSGYPTIHWDYPNLVSVTGGAINRWNSLVSSSPPTQSTSSTFGGITFGSHKFD